MRGGAQGNWRSGWIWWGGGAEGEEEERVLIRESVFGSPAVALHTSACQQTVKERYKTSRARQREKESASVRERATTEEEKSAFLRKRGGTTSAEKNGEREGEREKEGHTGRSWVAEWKLKTALSSAARETQGGQSQPTANAFHNSVPLGSYPALRNPLDSFRSLRTSNLYRELVRCPLQEEPEEISLRRHAEDVFFWSVGDSGRGIRDFKSHGNPPLIPTRHQANPLSPTPLRAKLSKKKKHV